MPEFDPAADLRQFMHEILLRFERTMDVLIAEMRRDREESTRRFDQLTAEFRQHDAESRAELRDLREESRAQRQALLRLIDRFDNGGAAPAG
jgi:transposase